MRYWLVSAGLLTAVMFPAADLLGRPDEPPAGTPSTDRDTSRERYRDTNRERDTTQPNTQSASTNFVFVSGDKIRGLDVKNPAGDSLGTINDLIIERGSGQVAYVILKTGAILGIGGKNVVVSYAMFGWDSADKHATLVSTPEQVKSWPEFDSGLWKSRSREDNSLSRSLSSQYFTDMSSNAEYPNAGSEDTRIKGRVTRVTRQHLPGHPEETIVTIATDDDRTEQVVLGPSWYVTGGSTPIYRDTPVELRVARSGASGPMTARTYSMNSRETRLYDDKGMAMWSESYTDKNPKSTRITPFVLASEIDGTHVECRGERCGKVDDVVVECMSGKVAFLSIDPDQNVLGIGDTKRLVPWSIVAAVSDDSVLLDASKPMIVSAPKTPSDLHALGTSSMYRTVYSAYDVNTPTFEPVRKK